MICTDTYRQRVENRVAADEGRGVYWEGKLIYSYLYNDKENRRFLPVLLPGAMEADIPGLLRDTTRYRLEVFELRDAQFEALYRELTHQPKTTKPDLRPLIPLPTGQALSALHGRRPTSPASSNTRPPNSSAARTKPGS